jgi:hypothetical protein
MLTCNPHNCDRRQANEKARCGSKGAYEDQCSDAESHRVANRLCTLEALRSVGLIDLSRANDFKRTLGGCRSLAARIENPDYRANRRAGEKNGECHG